MASRIAYNEIDALLFFRNTKQYGSFEESEYEILRMCDMYNIPVATNIATAEVLVRAIDNGDLDWRDLLNPRSEYNRKK